MIEGLERRGIILDYFHGKREARVANVREERICHTAGFEVEGIGPSWAMWASSRNGKR